MRQAKADETRERILSAFAAVMAKSGDGQVSFDELAVEAGVERRTVFRHFPSRDDLLRAFWVWINRRVTPQPMPERTADFGRLPTEAFTGFDRDEAIIRASLHTPAGREMRLTALPERRRRFRAALTEVSAGLSPSDRASLEAIAHLLYSAAAWETLKDYCGLTGREAGRTVAWAFERIVAGLGESTPRSRSR